MYQTSISGLWTIVFRGQDGHDPTRVTIQLNPGTVEEYIAKALEPYGDTSKITSEDYRIVGVSTTEQVITVRPRETLAIKLGISDFPS